MYGWRATNPMGTSTSRHISACAQAPRAIEQEQEALLKAKYGALQPKKKLLPKARPWACSCPAVHVSLESMVRELAKHNLLAGPIRR